ncbi:hypothetical protein BV20DRAFT_1034890 [Pilatotrama ljubarskyi]|nr:hypothetical protein BV20DRAFT_1034890 [Pilatotrama ljubarskyi]
MLARARTEGSIISISSTSEQGSASADVSSVHATPQKLRTFHSDSLLGSPSGRPTTPSPSRARPADDISSPPVRPNLVNSNVRTYAGKSRSFLVALPQSQAGTLGLESHSQGLIDDMGAMYGESQEDDFEMRESYTELRERWGVDASEDDPRPLTPVASPSPKGKGKKRKGLKEEPPVKVLPYGMMNDLKSITELRSKGESRRFLDEVGYLFEGLDAKGALGVRRGSALEIVTKLCDVDFARRAKAADFLGRAWEVLRDAGAGEGDKILDSILVFYAALVARDPTDLLDLASKSDFASTLHRILTSLERSNDPLWLISSNAGSAELKAAGISKAEVTLLGNLHRLIRKKSGLFEDVDLVSNRLLISQALAIVSPSAHTLSHLPALLHSLTAELNPIPLRVDAYISGLSLIPSEGPSSYMYTPSLLHLDNCLRLLDSCLLGSWSISGEEMAAQAARLEELRGRDFAKGLIALCACCGIILMDSDLQDRREVASKCMESALRVLINLTHDDRSWCEAVLDDPLSMPAIMHLIVLAQRQRRLLEKQLEAEEAKDEDNDDAARCLDRMCLALGLLTNLVQATPDAKASMNDTLLDFDCPYKRACIRGCRCPGRTSALACLAQVYAQHLSSSNELDVVVRGHMAVLFGLLMDRSPSNQSTLLDALPGASDREKLGALLQHAQDFTLFYVALSRKMAQARSRSRDEDEEPIEMGDEDSRYSSATRTARALRDSKGEAVAKGVIAFLKRLRDQSA